MPSKYVIIAGSHEDAMAMCRQEGLDSRSPNVLTFTPNSAHQLRGLRKQPGDRLITGYFDYSFRHVAQGHDAMIAHLKIGGWL